MKIAKKIILFGLCAALLIGASVMGSMAYLQSQSKTSVNVMTVGNVSIVLDESDPNGTNNERLPVNSGEDNASGYKLVPGTTIDKDPKVTVTGGSQDCWLFVKIVEEDVIIGEKTYKCTDFLSYAIEAGWTKLDIANEIIYYRAVAADENNQEFFILGADTANGKWSANQLYVKETITEEMLNALGTEQPALIFSAYAIQSSGFATALEAWNGIMAQTAPATPDPETSVSVAPEA